MEDLKSQGIETINKLVNTWTKKYQFQTKYVETNSKGDVFVTEFSLPIKQRPIPDATVKVYFYLKQGLSGQEHDIQYLFENDSLVHKPDKTIRIRQMEKWIEKYLEKKKMTSQILFLGTEFEQTRIKDERLDKIIAQMNYKEEFKEVKLLSPELLETQDELELVEQFVDEEKQILTMKKTIYDLFRSIDKDDLGVVSFSECQDIMKQAGLQLNNQQWKELLFIYGLDTNGLIEYQEFIPLGAEVIHGIFLKNQAEKQLLEREEEYLHEATLIMNNSELHDKRKEMFEACQKVDEEQEEFIKIADLKKIITNFGSVLHDKEQDQLLKIISKKFSEDKFRYDQLYDIILEMKIENLKNGLMESHLNQLEKYIRIICQEYDLEKKGLIHIDNLMQAFQKSNKITLPKLQTFMIENFADKDENGMVNYMIGSRILAAMIKKFFTPILIRKRERLIKEGFIKSDQFMEGWTEDDFYNVLKEQLTKFDKDKDQYLNLQELSACLQSNNVIMKQEDIEKLIETYGKANSGHICLEEFLQGFQFIVRKYRCEKAMSQLTDL